MNIRQWLVVGMIGIVSAGATSLAHGQDAYVGFGLGRSDDTAWDDSAGGFTLFGAWRFNKYVALEGGPTNLGKLGPENVETRGFVLQAVGIIPISKRVDFFAEAGLYDWEADIDGNKVDDGTDPTYGIGLHYHLGDNWTLRAEWERFVDVRDDDVDWTSLSAVYWFREP